MSAERIEVSLGRGGGKKVFENLQEIETWLAKEREFWQWLNGAPWTDLGNAINSRYQTFFQNVQNQLNQAKGAKQQSENAKQQPQLQPYLDSIKNFFANHYDQQLNTFSGTPFAKFLTQLNKDEGQSVAVAALAHSVRHPINLNQYEFCRGVLLCFNYEAGLLKRKPNEAQALEEMRVEWEKKFQGFRDALQTETDTHKRLNSDGQLLISKQDTAFKELLTKQESALNELVAKSKTEWNDLRKTYDDALAVRSPVTYWTRKAKVHFWLSWAYAFVSVLAAGLSLCFLIPEVQSMMQPPKGTQDLEKWHPEYWRLAVLIASALFCVWVVRILVRLLLSNIHLLTDARERVTMVQTYLALLRRGKLKDDERMFILQTLFRPTPTGIVKDDAVPLTIVEGITKLRG